MVTSESPTSMSDLPPKVSPYSRKKLHEELSWLLPGETDWLVGERSSDGTLEKTHILLPEDPTPPVAVVALPVSLVICQLFWLEATDEKVLPDLIRMQCERRSLRRQNEVWKYRIVRTEGERSLVQVLILQNTVPSRIEGEGESRFEVFIRCVELPPSALVIWRSLNSVCLALTDESGAIYFQPLPHRSLTKECLRDIQATIWLAEAQKWTSAAQSVELLGLWTQADVSAINTAFALPITNQEILRFKLPEQPMELTPPSVRQLRIARRRRARVRGALLALAGVYAIWLAVQIASGVWTSVGNTGLQSRLDAIMPKVQVMQTTARQLEALNPAIDAKTYPIEILYRAMALLPEKGVRLTQLEIVGDRLEIAGESTTAREAFDFIRNLEEAETLQHVEWNEAPQPIPLPNDTTRFSISGTLTGAYHDPEQT